MLENWRYNRARQAISCHLESNSQQAFLEQEYQTQLALKNLGIDRFTKPSGVPKVGNILMCPELIPNLRVPYAVEILGMPQAGKSTMINRYLEELWQRNERHKVALVDEGVRSIKQEHGDLRYSDPFSYSLLGGTVTFASYISSLMKINSGMRMVLSDRGQIDRRVFRRTLFARGDVNPEIMKNEGQFIYGWKTHQFKLGGLLC